MFSGRLRRPLKQVCPKLPLPSLISREVTGAGTIGSRSKTILLDAQGHVVPTDELFSGDALVLEKYQADSISLVHENVPYLTVKFDTPVVGVCSPVGKHAPFICIEPWYGRADAEDFTGSLEEREYGNYLPEGGSFNGGFKIIL